MIIVRYSEIGLKGKNRAFFEKALAKNIALAAKRAGIKIASISRPYGRLMVDCEQWSFLKTVFGIASYSPAFDGGSSISTAMKKLSEARALDKFVGKTFRVSCQRLDKTFAMSSEMICRELGAAIIAHTGAKAKMTAYDIELGVEVIKGRLWLFTERVQGLGGLPLGVEGRVVGLLKSEKDVLAALLMMKRGCEIIPVLLKSKKIDTSLLESFGNTVKPITLTKPSELDKLINQTGGKAIVTGQTSAI
ncbi:MAG: THUMP domain-containing protein [Candidatus Woesearchaeota archaeon]